MIIIIRALSHVRKGQKKRWPKKNREGLNKKEEGESPSKKMREKREGTMLLSFSTLVLQSTTMVFMIESLLFCHFHILVGISIIGLGLYIPTMGFLKCPRSS